MKLQAIDLLKLMNRSKHRRENGKKARTDKSSNQAHMERASSKNGHVLSAHD